MGARQVPRKNVLAVAAATGMTIALLAGSGVAAAGPKATATPPPAPTTWIYVANQIGSTMWAVAPDGSGLHQVGCWGDWSHNGAPRRMLQAEAIPGVTMPVWRSSQIVQMDVRRIVTRDESCGDLQVLWTPPQGMLVNLPTWSIDGRRVAFAAQQHDDRGQLLEQGIWVGDLDGSCGAGLCNVHEAMPLPMIEYRRDEAAALVEYSAISPTMRWSPDDRSVVYTHPVNGDLWTSALFLLDVGPEGTLATADEVRIPLGDHVIAAAFSPVDPNRLAVHLPNRTNACRNSDLALTTPSGGSIQWVTTPTNFASCSVGQWDWSPDGAWLAFNAFNKAGSRSEIWKIRPGAAKATLVLSTSGANYFVTGWR
jgi:Tol biopolymer transport system component